MAHDRVLAGLCVLLIGAWAGCNSPSGPPDPDRFGEPYEILTNLSPNSPDEPPAIISDSLSVLVAYTGGCTDHTFETRARVVGRAAAIILRHDNGGDTCEAYLHDRLVLPLPRDVLEAHEIHLLNPHADTPFVLRWDLTRD